MVGGFLSLSGISPSSLLLHCCSVSTMDWLSVAARQQRLLKKGFCFSCSVRSRPLYCARPFLSSQASRYYAFTPSPRRMAGRQRTTEADIDDIEGDTEPQQTHPLTGYYHDILVTESPYRRAAPTSRPVPTQTETEQPTPSATVEPQSPQDRMSIVFGTRLASPGRSSRYDPGYAPETTWKTVNGVAIPPRPKEPDNCCMSGCAHCVWDDYRDDMEEWAGRLETATAQAAPAGPTADMRQGPRAEVESASTSMDDDGGGSDTNWPVPEQTGDIFANIPVGIREFMKTEKRLKQRRHHVASA